MDYQEAKLANTARNRIWAIVFLHILCSPVGSAVYSGKQGNWLAFGAGTGLFIVGLPLAIVDLGLTAFILAPVASCRILANKGTESRRRLGIFAPEQADALVYGSSSLHNPGVVVNNLNSTASAAE